MRIRHHKHKFHLGTIAVYFLVGGSLLTGCALSGSVVDRSQIETSFKKIRMGEHSTLRIYYNDAVREIPLKNISSVKIDSQESRQINGEFCYGADVLMKDGSRVSSGKRGGCYISILNTIEGENKNGETYTTTLDNVTQINIEHR